MRSTRPATTRFALALLLAATPLIVSASGCDDGESTPTADASAADASTTADATTTTDDATAATGDATSTEDAGVDTGEDAVTPGATEWAVLVVGELADTPENIQAQHDQLAAGGEEAAKSLGDFGHDAFLGTALLGSTENEFLGLDRWSDLEGLQGFYSDPAFAEAFGMLFTAPPAVTTWARTDWHQWGDLDSADSADAQYFVVVRGRLAATDPAEAQAGHDAVASAGEAQVTAAGDVAHAVFLSVEDPQEFLAIDVWTSADAIEGVYTDPDFAAAFGSLFEAPPTLSVYAGTDWYQW